ncbi:hypothetical protein BN129_1061 [Cronobacter sakazakii 701]|nr:hypothetical protein BN129_1061 [Cronobacter sakazakii 701]
MCVIRELRLYCGEKTGSRQRLALGFRRHQVKAPLLGRRGFIPQIAAWAGNTAVALGAKTLHREFARFVTDTHDRRPDKRLVAPALHRKMLFAKARLGEGQTAGEHQRIHKLRFAQRSHLQLHRLSQAVIRFTVIFNNHAAGVGVADIQDEIHRHRLRAQRAGHDFQLRHIELVAEERHQVEPVSLIFKDFQRSLDLLLAAAFIRADKLGEGFTQPAVNPGLVKEISHFVIAPGKRETRAVAHVILDGRELGGRAFIGLNLRVERQRHAVGVARAVRLAEFADLHARPVVRALHKGTRWVKAQHRQRQPDAIQDSERLAQCDAAFRFHHFRLAAVAGGQGEFAGGDIVI